MHTIPLSVPPGSLHPEASSRSPGSRCWCEKGPTCGHHRTAAVPRGVALSPRKARAADIYPNHAEHTEPLKDRVDVASSGSPPSASRRPALSPSLSPTQMALLEPSACAGARGPPVSSIYAVLCAFFGIFCAIIGTIGLELPCPPRGFSGGPGDASTVRLAVAYGDVRLGPSLPKARALAPPRPRKAIISNRACGTIHAPILPSCSTKCLTLASFGVISAYFYLSRGFAQAVPEGAPFERAMARQKKHRHASSTCRVTMPAELRRRQRSDRILILFHEEACII